MGLHTRAAGLEKLGFTPYLLAVPEYNKRMLKELVSQVKEILKRSNRDGLFILFTDGKEFYWRLEYSDKGKVVSSPHGIISVLLKGDRKLALTLDHAYLLELMTQIGEDYPSIDDANICFYAERKSWGLVGRTDYPSEIIAQDYSIWEQKYLDLSNTINHQDVRKNQSDFILYCNYFQLKNLIDIKPDKGSEYIRSVCEPFDDEMVFDQKRVDNWLSLFSLPLTQIHTSGHASESQLFTMLKEIEPTTIYPIHTDSPEGFSEKFNNVVIIEKEKKYKLG